MRTERGQAMIELALGMLALSLVVSALCIFSLYIARSLEMQNSVRVDSPSQNDTISVGTFASTYIFGKSMLKIEEKAKMPTTAILK